MIPLGCWTHQVVYSIAGTPRRPARHLNEPVCVRPAAHSPPPTTSSFWLLLLLPDLRANTNLLRLVIYSPYIYFVFPILALRLLLMPDPHAERIFCHMVFILDLFISCSPLISLTTPTPFEWPNADTNLSPYVIYSRFIYFVFPILSFRLLLFLPVPHVNTNLLPYAQLILYLFI